LQLQLLCLSLASFIIFVAYALGLLLFAFTFCTWDCVCICVCVCVCISVCRYPACGWRIVKLCRVVKLCGCFYLCYGTTPSAMSGVWSGLVYLSLCLSSHSFCVCICDITYGSVCSGGSKWSRVYPRKYIRGVVYMWNDISQTRTPSPNATAALRREEIKYSSRMLVKFPFGMFGWFRLLSVVLVVLLSPSSPTQKCCSCIVYSVYHKAVIRRGFSIRADESQRNSFPPCCCWNILYCNEVVYKFE